MVIISSEDAISSGVAVAPIGNHILLNDLFVRLMILKLWLITAAHVGLRADPCSGTDEPFVRLLGRQVLNRANREPI